MPRLVKIGYTERSPQTRAIELSNHTGVPGNFSVVKSWRIQDAAVCEKKIFAELRPHRSTGEHFELSPSEAVKRINILLRAWGQIGEDGLTEIERIEAFQRRQKLEEAEKARKHRDLIREIVSEIQQAETLAANVVAEHSAPTLKERRIRALVVWSAICVIGAIFLVDSGSEQGPRLQGTLAVVAFWIWCLGSFFAWACAEVPGYEGMKKSACEAAKRRILSKRGLPPTWTPPA